MKINGSYRGRGRKKITKQFVVEEQDSKSVHQREILSQISLIYNEIKKFLINEYYNLS